MKMNLKKLSAKADNDVFDEIIAKCESKMASPFKKEVEVEVEPEAEDQAHEESESPEMEKSEISPEDLQKLLELYQQMKG